MHLAADDREAPAGRAAALAALGDSGDPGDGELTDLFEAVARRGGALGEVARLARADLGHRGEPPTTRSPGQGLTVAQLFLHADIDGSLKRAGQGDTGGIATLLVHLGDALLADPGKVTRVVTISRGRAGDHADLSPLDPAGHHYRSVPFWDPPVPAARSWPRRVATRRAVRRILSQAHVDVLHLRMADVGSWAGAEAARDLGIPVVLTLAPDPHASVAAREADGHLSRRDFGAVDEVEHLVFRMRLLQELQRQAARLVVFPRPALEASLRDLLGLDLAAEEIAQPGRVTTVPEGIDPLPLDRAAVEVVAVTSGGYASAPTCAALAELDELLGSLPAGRRGLPLVVSVGRLHPVKGMATLVEAWAGSPDLRDRANLLVVGGDLDEPNADEQGQLERIDAVVARNDGPGHGLLLAGHRPNATVAVWLAAVRYGRPALSAPAGAYVSASLKEEFGIAILEAMASGLVVVAPWEGGPATYVDDGVTGILADTGSTPALADAVMAALDLAAAPDAPENAEAAERLVRERFGIQTMAAALAEIYGSLYPGAGRHDPAGHQPRLRVPPLPARHPGHGLAAGRRARRRRHRARHRRDRAGVRLRAGHLQLGRGSNPGVIRAEDQPTGEDDALRGFFAATRRGAVETLTFQAEARGDDLLWDPLRVAREVSAVVDRVRPDQVVVDHLAFSARLALTASGVRHGDVVLGHPTALTVGSEVYGYPPVWPRALHPDPAALAHLHDRCVGVRDAFTARWNETLRTLDPSALASDDAFAETGDVLLLNYPEELHPPERTRLLPPHSFLGSAVRSEAPDAQVDAWLGAGTAPVVYVSLGSFLSVRGDVLATVAEALRGLDVRVALASGSTPEADLGPLPPSWLVRRVLPQVTLLQRSAVTVTHGGNNSVTEALTAGASLVVLPFSTDQFAAAAAIEDSGYGEVLDPNATSPAEVRAAVERLLDLGPAARTGLDALSHRLTAVPGAVRARTALRPL